MSCVDNEPCDLPTANLSPKISDFVLYAERSIKQGDFGRIWHGAVGIHAIAEREFGFQLQIGTDSIVDPRQNLYAPSTALGRDVTLGILQTNARRDDGVRLGSPWRFPALAMPPLPLVQSCKDAQDGRGDVSVEPCEVMALLPGSYGDLKVFGTLLLNPGEYCCSSVILGDFARVIAIAGDVQLTVDSDLTAGRHVIIYPAFRKNADQLRISVCGGDGQDGRPAVSIGERGVLKALLVAPHGTISFGDQIHATGAFMGFDIALGQKARIEFECGFPEEEHGQRGSQQLEGYYGVHPDPSVAPLAGPVEPDTIISLAVGLPVRNPSGLQTLIKQVSDPKSASFRKHLTQDQFRTAYGATDADYQTLKDWTVNSGLAIDKEYSNNLLLSVRGTAAQIGQALFVNLVYRLRRDGSKFVAVDREPSLNLAVPLLQISGLADFFPPQIADSFGTGSGAAFRAADLRNAYLGVDSPCQSLDGTGQVVGIVGYDVFATSDIAGYDALQLPVAGQPSPLPSTNVKVVVAEGGNPPSGAAAEATADVQFVHAMAPNATILFFQGSSGITHHLDDVLHAMATSNPPLTVANFSLFFGRSDNSQQALDQMAAQGVSVFAAAGDFGDVGDPQNNLDMDNVTIVGGTILSTNQLDAPLPNPVYRIPYYAGEATWNVSTGSKAIGVTGGGIMDGNNKNGQCFCWPYSLGPFSCCGSGVDIPDYQRGIMEISAGFNGGSTTFRNFPDVSMIAFNVERFFAGTTSGFAGTSISAPLWAGFIALANQKSLQNNAGLMGFLNPTLYDIGLTSGDANDLYAICFNDIQDGVSNGNGFGSGFKAVQGYDLATGLGTPTCALINQLSSSTPLVPNQPLDLIRFVITTGADDLGGGEHGSDATADVFLQDGTSFNLTLRHRSEPNWDPGSTHTVDFNIPTGLAHPPTQSYGIAGVKINLVQDNPDISADNWDITSLSVSLFNPPFATATAVCQLNLVGNSKLQDDTTGLIRLSKKADGSGSGPTSPLFSTGPGSGCP